MQDRERRHVYDPAEDEIAAYQDTASRLQQSALEADDSLALIEHVLREMT